MTEREAPDDERGALIDASEAMTADEVHDHPYAALDKIRGLTRELRIEIARKHPEPEITDEMVERAAMAVGSVDLPHWTWDQNLESGLAADYRKMARFALEAALIAPVGVSEATATVPSDG